MPVLPREPRLDLTETSPDKQPLSLLHVTRFSQLCPLQLRDVPSLCLSRPRVPAPRPRRPASAPSTVPAGAGSSPPRWPRSRPRVFFHGSGCFVQRLKSSTGYLVPAFVPTRCFSSAGKFRCSHVFFSS